MSTADICAKFSTHRSFFFSLFLYIVLLLESFRRGYTTKKSFITSQVLLFLYKAISYEFCK